MMVRWSGTVANVAVGFDLLGFAIIDGAFGGIRAQCRLIDQLFGVAACDSGAQEAISAVNGIA